MPIDQTLTLVSIFLYLTEFALFIYIKKLIQLKETFYDLMLEQVAELLRKVRFEHVAAYSGVYFIILFLGKLLPFVLTLLITIQMISISINLLAYFRIKSDDL